MSGFEAEWLAARRPYDEAALDRAIVATIREWGSTFRVQVGNPAPLATRLMKTLEFSRDAVTRVITLTHESPYTGRRRPAAGWFSDRDQQKRHPGDRFCERVPFAVLVCRKRRPVTKLNSRTSQRRILGDRMNAFT